MNDENDKCRWSMTMHDEADDCYTPHYCRQEGCVRRRNIQRAHELAQRGVRAVMSADVVSLYGDDAAGDADD